jgi:hypothetical protein
VTITVQTVFSLVAPGGGETVPSGSIYKIQWTAIPTTTQFKLYYTMDNALTWIPITTDFIGGTSYDWTVPATSCNRKDACLIKVKGYDAYGVKIGADVSDKPFTIEVVNVDLPNGGESFAPSERLTITWTTNETKSYVAKVKLYYTKDKGVTWDLIDTIRGSNPGSYEWIVPAVWRTKEYCKVRVVLLDMSGNTLGRDASDSYFTIQP